MKVLTVGSLLVLALPVFAQDDRIIQTNGEAIDGAKVTAFEVTEIRYMKNGRNETLPTDRVAKVELAKFEEVYRRGVSGRDAGLFLNTARERVDKKDPLMAQFGFVAAANLFLSSSDDDSIKNGFAVLEEMQQKIPNAGLLPEVYRSKFDYYSGKGDFANALTVARKFQSDATTSAWPQGFQIEGEFLVLMAEGGRGSMDKPTFQARMRDLLGRTEGSYPSIANRANIQLADSLRLSGDKDGARKIYEGLIDRDGIDDNSRAGALLGMGYLQFAQGDAGNKEPFKEALLNFLRVHLMTKDAYDSLHAEALYNAALAARNWGGEDSLRIFGRCRYVVTTDPKYSGSKWAQLAKKM